VITNSSTVVYVQGHDKTIEYAKSLINTLIKSMGKSCCADDYFTFSLEVNKQRFIDNVSGELESFEDEIKAMPEYSELDLTDLEWGKSDEIAEVLYNKIIKKEIKEPDGFRETGEGWNIEELIITPKNGQKDINLTNEVEHIFNLDGERDG